MRRAGIEQAIRDKYIALAPTLDERSRRLWAATEASGQPLSSGRVEAVQLDPGVGRREPPTGLDEPVVPGVLPRLHPPPQFADALHPPGQALPGEHRELALGHVQPAPVPGRVVPLDLLGEPSGGHRVERLIQASGSVAAHVVGQPDPSFGSDDTLNMTTQGTLTATY